MASTDSFSGHSHLTWPDYAIVSALLVLVIIVGLYFGREEKSTRDFFLGGRKIPWWAACLAFIATEISAVTLIAVPAIAYMENWEYAQFFLGSFAARVVIAFLFIPAFYHYNCTTIYEFLRHRFGPETQIAGSILFFITRLMASGVRFMAACLAVSVLIDWPILPTILVFGVISTLYITWGGIKAVVWTNVVQGLTFLLAGVVAIAFLLSRIEGGSAAVLAIAGAAGKLKIFNWGPGLAASGPTTFAKSLFTDPNLLILATLNGFFGSMAAFGTDQESMQRLLTVETRKKSQRTMLLTPIGSFLMMVIFLAVGTCLYAFYAQHPGLALPAKLDKIFPHFIGQVMPAGLTRAHAVGHRHGQPRVAGGVADHLLCHRHLPPGDQPHGHRAPLSPRLAVQRGRVCHSPGGHRLFSQPLRENPLVGLQNRRGDLRLPAGGLSPGLPHQNPLQPHQRGGHVFVRPGHAGAADSFRKASSAPGVDLAALDGHLPDLYDGLAPGHQSGGRPGGDQRR